MRRTVKVKAKATASRILLRKAALTASTASRRPFPAWIAADEGGVAFPATVVTSRVRDALVLRTVGKKKSANAKSSPNGHGAR